MPSTVTVRLKQRASAQRRDLPYDPFPYTRHILLLLPQGDVATPDGDRIRTSCHEPYWLYEGASCPAAEIRNPQHCTIDVASLPAGWRHDAAPDAPEIRAVLARICGGDNTRSRDIGGGASGEVGADCEAGAAGATGATAAPAPAWVLDICLDYFSTGNPFFDRLRRALPAPGDVAAVAAVFWLGLDFDYLAQFSALYPTINRYPTRAVQCALPSAHLLI